MLRSLLLLGAMSMVGLTAWNHTPLVVSGGVLPDSVEIDAWEGLCSQAKALGDSLLRFPCAVGWGAGGAPQQDSIRAGVGTVKVWKVTVQGTDSTSPPGSLAAALDSAAVYDDGKTCSYIIAPQGGEFFQFEGNWAGISCVRFSFQTAQGEGVNIRKGNLQADTSTYVMAEYWYSRRPWEANSWPTGEGDNQCSKNWYMQHGSAAWGSTQENLSGQSCGSSFPNDTSLNTTYHRMLLGEPDSLKPTHMNNQADQSWQHRRITVLENAFTGPGHRCPRTGTSDSVSVVRNITYNCVNQYGESATGVGKVDVFDNLMVPGPASPAASSMRRWAWTVVGDSDIDTTFTSFAFRGNRAPRSGYDETMHPDSFVFGSNRDVMVRCGSVTWCTGDGQPVVPGMIRTDTLPTAAFANAEIEFGIVMDSVASGKILAIAGNSRYLTCRGQWTLRSDSVDVRFRDNVLDSVGPSALVDATNGGRTYGVPASGTVCPDADDDGLPNEYESANGLDFTDLDPGEVINGRPVIEWYLAGRDTDGSLIGCNGTCSAESGSIAATFGAVDRYVYIVPMQSLFGLNFPNFSPLSSIRFGVINAAGDSMVVVTCAASGTPADSATVHTRLAAWARPTLNTAVALRDHTPRAGMGC